MSFNPVESLEERRHLSASLLNGVLTVGGTGGNDIIAVTVSNSNLVVKVGTTSKVFALAKVAKLVVNAGSGNDTVTIAGNVSKPATLNGQDGSDILRGGNGNDVINGGNGNDTARGGGGRDTFIGGTGIDTVDYSLKTTGIKVDLDGVADDGSPGEGDNVNSDIENIRGGSGGDVLIGDDDANDIDGNGGNDIIDGNGGDDDLSGGAGHDDLDGGDGDDDIDGDAGNDYLDGEEGDDDLDGEDGNDLLEGGGDDDDLDGGAGNDDLAGERGANRLRGGSGRDSFRHSGGDDDVEDRDDDEDEEVEGRVLAVDLTAGTITIAGEDGGLSQTFTVASDAKIQTEDGDTRTLGEIPGGAEVELSLSATNPALVTGIEIEDGDDDEDFEGRVASVNAAAGTITLFGEDGRANRTFSVAPNAVIRTEDGVARTLAQIPVGAEVELYFSATNPDLVVAIDIEDDADGVEGDVLAVNASARTITIKEEDGGASRTFTVAADARIRTEDGATRTLDQIVVGSEVELTLSLTDPTVVSGIEVDDDDGDDDD